MIVCFAVDQDSQKALAVWHIVKEREGISDYYLLTVSDLRVCSCEYDSGLRFSDIKCDVVVVIGGDGFMLKAIHALLEYRIQIYGINAGTVGFLLNKYVVGVLMNDILTARIVMLPTLAMEVRHSDGSMSVYHAVNEVSLIRQTKQSAKIEIYLNSTNMGNIVGDGILVATPAGSTAYNSAARGPILPLNSRCIAMTPICIFRPRGWNGAVIEDSSRVEFSILEAEKRPVNATADFWECRDVSTVSVSMNNALRTVLLFSGREGLDKRVLNEQFGGIKLT
ncbi:putative inorganic polyphosphate/ATP-NAD kinase [Candidatus Fokinia solitaria]|uniref:Putative inorganic polyphosphate/ATP-NAD kinase n=1 Tax=Candidatus Fokinia solitaria TaxID=1802984 RepID=A0A2U8BST7_9RICK|nr:NAD kinase [Candidatus Fokinia solitaria]AWD33402.1 putative inorganic polyphosphate/ATP-NAD kinase [Candidatus Fokinia solitaria]